MTVRDSVRDSVRAWRREHAADENLRLGNLWYGVDLFALLLTTPWPERPRPGEEA